MFNNVTTWKTIDVFTIIKKIYQKIFPIKIFIEKNNITCNII